MSALLELNQPETSSFSVDDFTGSLLAGIVEQGKSRIPIGHPQVESGFREIVEILHRSALNASAQSRPALAFQILEVLEELRPDPNSGLLEGFWSSLRRQQPGRASVPNPSYSYLQLRLGPADAKLQMDELPTDWKPIVKQAVDLLMQRI